MNNEFIPYEQALALKEMGFDEECFSFYSCDNDNDVYFSVDPDDLTLDWVNHSQYDFNNAQHIYRTSAPLYQQAFRWFREKYDSKSFIANGDYSVEVTIDGVVYRESATLKQRRLLNTYEEAELACLRKLIEIVKQNKDE